MNRALAAFCLLASGVCSQAHAADAASGNLPNCIDLGSGKPVMQTRFSLEDSYPPLSVILGEQGSTTVSFTIAANGTVSGVKLLQSSGSLRLDDATVKAASQLLYSQPKRDGKTSACFKKLTVVWKLTGSESVYAQQMARVSPPLSLYPPDALARHVEGATVVGVVMGDNGAVMKTKIEKSSGSQVLDDASLAYARTLQYKPVEVGGKPAASGVTVVVMWTLPPKSAENAK